MTTPAPGASVVTSSDGRSGATEQRPGSVVTLGETMALLATPPSGRVLGGSALSVGIGGAESNVAIGLARLGVPATWMSRVGDDAFGTLVVREIQAEGVRVVADRDPVAPTGLMVKEFRAGRPHRVRYYRSGSAASRFTPAHVDDVVIAEADVLHVTGITAALGDSARATVEHAVAVARSAGTLVSFDVNHRATLWSDKVASPVLAHLAGLAGLLFAGPEEAGLLLGQGSGAAGVSTFDEGEVLAQKLGRLAGGTVVLKLGALGALALSGDRVERAPTRPVQVVDAVGAGDAFVAGYLARLVRGGSVSDCLHAGNLLGGAVCQVPGDWEGLPTADELADLTGGAGEVIR